MGFRTVVLLNNDLTREWQHDPALGDKIHHAAAMKQIGRHGADFRTGTILEVAHADVQTLGVIESFTFTPLAHSHWYQGQKDEVMQLNLLKDAADRLGYRLVRKSK